MRRVCRVAAVMAVAASFFFATSSHAGVVIAGTRIIFPSQEREVTVKVSNASATPALIQTWIDKGEAGESPEKIDVPFTLTPTMFRLEPNKGQTLRLIYTKEPLAQDKETLFWLNVLEIPPKPKADRENTNHMQLAFRTRIKLMFRPKELTGDPAQSPAQMRWELIRSEDGNGYRLKATNPTPYFVNLGSVDLRSGEKSYYAGSGFVPPGGSEVFSMEKLTQQPGPGAQVRYKAINDYGAGVEGNFPL